MSKLIKKQIKRSMPWFLIFSLIISSMVAGLVFNLDLDVTTDEDYKVVVSVSLPEVQAQEQNTNATTTVEVRNAPPNWVGYPFEVVGSTSTSPINEGEAIQFRGTADDPESLDYWLIVCSSDSVSSNNDSAPSCGGTQFCVSSLTTSGSAADCIYTNVDDTLDGEAGEVEDWYAFICDNHSSQGECAVSSQGDLTAVSTSSPFYINRAPTLQEASTTVDNIDPGGTYTLTATTSDLDITGGNDEIQVDFCETASWATTTYNTSGCSVPICTATGTSAGSGIDLALSCSGSVPAIATDTDYTYYAYVQDWHSLQSPDNNITNTYTVVNVAPVVSNLVVNSGADINLNIKWAPEVTATTSAVVTDYNGCGGTELDIATSSIYWENATNTLDCTSDDNVCYQIASTECNIYGCIGAQANVLCTTTLAYNALPTDDGIDDNPASTTKWYAGIRVYDDDGAHGASTTEANNAVEIIASPALSVLENIIDYSQLQAGTNSGTSTATTTVVNFGNTPLDVSLSGTDMSQGGDLIEIENQKHDTSQYFDYDLTGTNATDTAFINYEDILVPRPTTTASTSDNVYWGIAIPGATPSGNYEGLNTFWVVTDTTNGEWQVP